MGKKAFIDRSKGTQPKKKLIRTKQESARLRIIITVIVLLAVSVTYYLIDSWSYVATVDGNRISKAEYSFFLSQQKAATEQKEGLSGKTDKEKEAFWTETKDGQNPWEEVKREALNSSKEYMMQLIKAKEMGLKVDSSIKSEVASLMKSTKGTMTTKQFNDYVSYAFHISPNQLSKISENMMLIDQFKKNYLEKEYTAKPVTDEDVKSYYGNDPKQFDKVDISYVTFAKTDENGKELSKEETDAKRKKAEEALGRIKKGENVDNIIKEYSENKTSEESSSDSPTGKATLSYSQGTMVQGLTDWVFANKPGDAGIVDTDYAIYVVRIDGRTDFEDAKTSVKAYMEDEAKQKFYDGALQEWSLEPRYNIIKNDKVYDSISYQ